MIEERKEDEVLAQSFVVWREVAAPGQLLKHDVMAPVEVLLGQLRLRQPDQSVEQECDGEEQRSQLVADFLGFLLIPLVVVCR